MKETLVLNDTLCEHIADLAKLNINKEEKEAILKDMKDIVGFVSKLGEDISHCDGISLPAFQKSSMREDIPEDSFSREKILSASSSLQNGYVTVPKVIEA